MVKPFARLAMRLSLWTAVLMLLGKMFAWYITGSTAILSDAAESLVHILATGVAALSLWYASQPADQSHPYGHGKIAYFSIGFEGAFILSAALFILYAGIHALVTGPELRQLDVGLAITAGLMLVNLALGLFLIYAGKKTNEVILIGNGKHVLTDMWTSLGVVGGVALVWITDILWIDPVVAILVGLNIMGTAGRLIYQAFGGLLDQADRGHTQTLIDCLENARTQGQISDFHQLRHRSSNDVIWVEMHVLLPGGMSVREAHEHVTEVENALRARFPGHSVHITTHIEPTVHEQAHPRGHTAPDPLATHTAAGAGTKPSSGGAPT